MEKWFKGLIVWKKSINLAIQVYKVTEKFPKSEIFWLTSQIQRCTVSISSNIAEGYGRKWLWEYKQFLSYSLWSCNELETQFIIAKEIWYMDSSAFENIENQIQEISKILYSLINKESKYSPKNLSPFS